MTERSLSEQIKMEADEVLFDTMHFDTRLKDQVRERVKQEGNIPAVRTAHRRMPWLQLSLVAAVVAVVLVGGRVPRQLMNTQSAAPMSPSGAPPNRAVADLGYGTNEKVISNEAAFTATAKQNGTALDIVLTGTVLDQEKSLTVKAAAPVSPMIAYNLRAELPTAPVTLKTAAEAWEELQKRVINLAPDERTVTITRIELVQRPPDADQTGNGELCYLFSGHVETGAPFSQYVYAEKGKTAVPE